MPPFHLMSTTLAVLAASVVALWRIWTRLHRCCGRLRHFRERCSSSETERRPIVPTGTKSRGSKNLLCGRKRFRPLPEALQHHRDSSSRHPTYTGGVIHPLHVPKKVDLETFIELSTARFGPLLKIGGDRTP